jgi:hypothetical protein
LKNKTGLDLYIPHVLLFDIDIRLIQGFLCTMRKSGMATVAFSYVGGGRPVGGGLIYR